MSSDVNEMAERITSLRWDYSYDRAFYYFDIAAAIDPTVPG